MGEYSTTFLSVLFIVFAVLPVVVLLSSIMASSASGLVDWSETYIGGFMFFVGVLGLGVLANWKHLSEKKRED